MSVTQLVGQGMCHSQTRVFYFRAAPVPGTSSFSTTIWHYQVAVCVRTKLFFIKCDGEMDVFSNQRSSLNFYVITRFASNKGATLSGQLYTHTVRCYMKWQFMLLSYRCFVCSPWVCNPLLQLTDANQSRCLRYRPISYFYSPF